MNLRLKKWNDMRHSPAATTTLRWSTISVAVLALSSVAGQSQQASPGDRNADAPGRIVPVSFTMRATAAQGDLPDAPDGGLEAAPGTAMNFSSSAAPGDAADAKQGGPPIRPARPTDKYISPGQSVPTLTVGNKVALGIKDAISPLAFIGWAASAGYEQATNGSPNYGQNGAKPFGQRFGAAAARATSEGIFSDSIMASVLHEDPRYYRLGPGNNFVKRVVYSGTRTLITRTDGGHLTPNFALLSGNLAGAYLTKAYYPELNRSNTEVLKTFGGSVGGSALGFFVSEFLSGALNVLHISRPTAN